METLATIKKSFGKKAKRAMASVCALATAASATATTAFAFGNETVTVTANATDAGALMGKIIGILLTITRFVGVALIIYGVYEIVMSFMQNQPEAKTKGIVMALAGVAMVALKSILTTLGVVS